jgi:hypothetical protein
MSTGLPDFVGTHDWAWPVGEILHFFGMAALIGTVGIVDLRILGVAKQIPIHELEKFVWIGVVGFLINIATGIMFVGGNPVGGPKEYLENLAFLIKMALVLIAGINVLVFYVFGISKKADAVGPEGTAPASAKAVAIVSLVVWFAVILFGRLIMYNDTLLYTLGL